MPPVKGRHPREREGSGTRPFQISTTLTASEKSRVTELAGDRSISAWLYDQIAHLLDPVDSLPVDPNQSDLFAADQELIS